MALVFTLSALGEPPLLCITCQDNLIFPSGSKSLSSNTCFRAYLSTLIRRLLRGQDPSALGTVKSLALVLLMQLDALSLFKQ